MKFDSTVSYFYKYAGEDFQVEYDFDNDLASGDSVSSCTASIYDIDDTNKTASFIESVTQSGTKAYFDIKSGQTAGDTYSIKLAAVSANGHTIIHRINCEVVEGVTINAKLADPDQNSYGILEEANDYIRNKYGHENTWDTLSPQGKNRILIEAANDMEIFNYNGDKYYDMQALSFPRDDHEVVTGNCTATITAKSFKHANLKPSSYGDVGKNYWKYGSCHLDDYDETGFIASSNVAGHVQMTANFTASIGSGTSFVVFAPVDRNIRYAQYEQALFITENQNIDSVNTYKNLGAEEVRIGDVRVVFREGATSKIPVSSSAKKLLSRYIRKVYRLGRA